MAQRRIIFHVKDLYDLMTAYNDGRNLPLYAEVKAVEVSRIMPRMFSLIVEAREWAAEAGDVSPVTGELKPLEFLYEGRHNMTFTSGKGEDPRWHETEQL
jgi:hypothetical protein